VGLGAGMENTVVVAEYPAGTDPEMLRKTAAAVADEADAITRVDCYRRLDGPDRYDYWLLAELASPQHAGAVATMLTGTAGAVQAYHEVFRMKRDEWGMPQHISTSAEIETTPDDVLTVVLPVPPGRAGEWNRWYDGHHMPTVFTIAPAVAVGHRFAPISEPSSGDYLVLYEFTSRADLDAWQAGTTVAGKHDEYVQRWGVYNTRRAWTLEFRVEPQR
jgi:hypothetical protein